MVTGEEKVQNVMIISEVQSYLVLSLKERFEEANYHVIQVKADIGAISRIEEPVSMMILYTDE